MKVNFAAIKGGLTATITASLVLGLTSFAFGQTKIMCVGDSITGGWGPSVGTFHASYRYPLWFDLLGMGYDVEFVGPFNDFNGPGCTGGQPGLLYPLYNDLAFQGGRHHAAICAADTLEIRNAIQNWVSTYQPEVILIHVGGRDVGVSGAAGVDNADANLRTIIDIIRTVQPTTKILLAQITPLAIYSSYGSNGAFVSILNGRISTIVTDKNLVPGFPPVILVDQNTGFDIASMMQFDGIHPNSAGEQRMADVWRDKLSSVLGPAQTCQPEIPVPSPNSLLALYTFDDGTVDDGTARDVSVTNNRTCVGYGSPQFETTGYEGGGLALDGISYLWADIPLDPTGHPQLTMGAWVLPYSVTPNQFLMSHDNGGSDRAILILADGNSTGWAAFAGPGGAGGSGNLGFFAVRHLQWQFVAAVYNKNTQSVSLYVDGESLEGQGNPGLGDNYLQIGHTPWTGCVSCTRCANGLCSLAGILDNVFVMSEALSIPRLNEIMTGGYHRIPTCPVIIRQPTCAEVCSGNVASFAVDGAGSELIQPLTFQWRKDGLPLFNGGNVSGATSPELAISSVLLADTGLYDCVVTNGCGSATSNAATLAVIGSMPGDGNGDGAADGLDIAGFVNALISSPPGAGAALCAYDLNMDAAITTNDLPLFVNVLLGS